MFLLIVFTANILGSFNDPFEFEGDYGTEMNPTRNKVFELVVPRETLAKHLTDKEIADLIDSDEISEDDIIKKKNQLVAKAIADDSNYGPTLGELFSDDLLKDLLKSQQQLKSFSPSDLDAIKAFIKKYQDQKIFRFLHHTPSGFLGLDKTLADKAAQAGKEFSLPVLSSTAPLKGTNSYEVRRNLLNAIFTNENLSHTKSKDALKKSLHKYDENLLKDLLGNDAQISDIKPLCSPAGQAFIYYLYHSLNLYLVADNPEMINEINKVKKIFSQTLGNATQRATAFKEKLVDANAGVLFTQESDNQTKQTLTEDGLFHPVDTQNPGDGCFVFLKSDLWHSDYEVLQIDGYEGFYAGKLNLIFATKKTGEKFLLASAHGNSRNAADGRLQIALITEAYYKLQQERGLDDLQLLIGMDANTKTENDISALHKHLDNLGLVATKSGPTTVKRRMVTVQHSKAGKLCIDEEDFLITLKPDNNGKYILTDTTVAFSKISPSPCRMLPDVDNPSDHYPVGATLVDGSKHLSR